MVAAPPRNVPTVNVIQDVVCVSAFAVCNCSGVAIRGRIAERPLLKNGEANMSAPLNAYSSQRWRCVRIRMNASATTKR